MKPLHLAALLALTGAVAFAQTGGRNSDSTTRRDRAPAESPRAASATPAGSLFEIEITDGSFVWKGKKSEALLENVVDMLRERHDGANIVLSPGLPRIRIANLRLRATTLEQELEALRVASGYKFAWSAGNNPNLVNPHLNTGVPPGGPTGALKQDEVPLYILSEGPGVPEFRRRVDVFNLSEYFSLFGPGQDEELRQKLVNEIKTMVTHTLDAVDQDGADTLGFQFHSGANLLVVVGTPDALEVARRVVNALQGQTAPAAGEFPPGVQYGGGYSMPVPRTPFIQPAISKERRAIMGKLEGIRLDSVLYDGAPLSEVVQKLVDETKKRDPEKRGINFLANPNQPPAWNAPGVPATIDPGTGLPVSAPPQEPVDINAVSIRINPPLNNVRLVDALEAIVRVADHPIKYTVTDYGVVFSLRGPDEPVPGGPGSGLRPGYPGMQ